MKKGIVLISAILTLFFISCGETKQDKKNRDFSFMLKPASVSSIEIGENARGENPREQFYDGRRIVRKDTLFGFVDQDSSLVIPCVYSKVSTFRNKTSIVHQDEKRGMIDTNGEFLIPLDSYEELKHFKEGFSFFKKGEEFGFFDTEGKKLIFSDKFEECGRKFRDSRLYVVKDGKVGFVDKKGELVIPHLYDGIVEGGFCLGLAPVKKGGKYGAINVNGDEMIPFEYDGIYDLWGEGNVTLEKGGKEAKVRVEAILDGSVKDQLK